MNKTFKGMIISLMLLAGFNATVVCAGEEPELTACTEPRPQVCTMDYTPVCARHEDGSYKTYSNGCTACANPSVAAYMEGACETE
jgi:hypothetical protein